jgi:hypothetical protein
MTDTNAADDQPNESTVGKITKVRLGVALILVSGILWFSLFAVPFLPLTVGQKTVLGGSLFVGVQLAWWSGAALAGPQMIQKLTGWFRRSRNRPPDE